MGLDPIILHTVVAVGEANVNEQAGESMHVCASAFLYAYPKTWTAGENNSDFRLWLVTCKHVINSLMQRGKIMVRFNTSMDSLIRSVLATLQDSPASSDKKISIFEHLVNKQKQTFRISLKPGGGPNWTLSETADVAVIPAYPEHLVKEHIQWGSFSARKNAVTREGFVKFGLGEGDDVFMVGFPVGWRTGWQDWPIVRKGILSQVQGFLKGDHLTYLVDGSGFPGHSGGPVLTKDIYNMPGYRLIGMVSSSSLHVKDDIREMADLINVVPVDQIDRTIEQAMLLGEI